MMNSPFKGAYKMTSVYGVRTLEGKTAMHNGLDLVGIDDKTIYAPCDGVIGASTIITNKKNKTWEWGNYVRLDTADGKYSMFFCHMDSRNVKKGQTVKAGDIIGVMGNTGYSFGSHLHFEVRKKGTSTTVNPCDLLNILNKIGIYGETKIAPVVQKVGKIEVGSTVKVKKGAKTFNGGTLASFVYDRNHQVKSINVDRVVITYNGVIVAAVRKQDLVLI